MVMLPAGRPALDRAQLAALVAPMGTDLAAEKLTVVGIRGFYFDLDKDGRNDRGIYDDAIALITEGEVTWFNANTDPSRSLPGTAVLTPGRWSVYRFRVHRGSRPHEALGQDAGEVTVIRDGRGPDTGMFGINIHCGGENSTSSLGCQTIPPSQWPDFIGKAHAEAKRLFGDNWRRTTITYTLVDLVETIQGRLGLKVDGVYGPATRAAVIAFQQSRGLDDDGIAGPVTLAELLMPAPAPDAGAQLGDLLGKPVAPLPPAEVRFGPDGYLTPAAFIRAFIEHHEGTTFSMDPKDKGTFFNGRQIGSKMGVTGASLQAYHDRHGITDPVDRQAMERVTMEIATVIGVEQVYEAGGFAKLPWNRVTMAVLDMGYLSGPRQAIRLAQRMVGAGDDGRIGPETVSRYANFIALHGEEEAARRYRALRDAFFESLNQPRFTRGWKNRAAAFLPGTPWWGGAKK